MSDADDGTGDSDDLDGLIETGDVDLPPEEPFPGEDVPDEQLEEDDGDTVLDRLRGSGVGVEDPNIVGDAGPTDIPPGADPPNR